MLFQPIFVYLLLDLGQLGTLADQKQARRGIATDHACHGANRRGMIFEIIQPGHLENQKLLIAKS